MQLWGLCEFNRDLRNNSRGWYVKSKQFCIKILVDVRVWPWLWWSLQPTGSYICYRVCVYLYLYLQCILHLRKMCKLNFSSKRFVQAQILQRKFQHDPFNMGGTYQSQWTRPSVFCGEDRPLPQLSSHGGPGDPLPWRGVLSLPARHHSSQCGFHW